MKRDPLNADGKKGDVYSLAKTLWMFLTNDSKGFDGEYSYYSANHSLRSFEKLRSTHLVEIEEPEFIQYIDYTNRDDRFIVYLYAPLCFLSFEIHLQFFSKI